MLPTYLYVKQHTITGLKYFGKTIKDPYVYPGSGTHCNTTSENRGNMNRWHNDNCPHRIKE